MAQISECPTGPHCIDHSDVKFGIQIGSDWLKMRQIWDFLRSVSVHFGSSSQNVLKLILKSLICPIWGQSDPFWMPNLTSLGGTSKCQNVILQTENNILYN